MGHDHPILLYMKTIRDASVTATESQDIKSVHCRAPKFPCRKKLLRKHICEKHSKTLSEEISPDAEESMHQPVIVEVLRSSITQGSIDLLGVRAITRKNARFILLIEDDLHIR